MHDLQVNLDELSCKHSKLEYEAGLDFLTGLANRQRIMKLLSNSYQKRKRENMPLSVIMADLDRFKSVNDEYGHQVGDIVLQTVAARIAAAVREKDIIGRYGGEEFIVVLADKNLDQAAQIAERIRMQIADTPIKTPNISINMTISLGVAEAYGNEHMGKLIARADSALYQAKMNGRNSVVLDCITKPQNKGDASFVV
jgi:two-component system, cell cycle response regulator